MKDITLPVEFANALVEYLASRPYAEVAGAVQTLSQALAEAEAAAAVTETPVAETAKAV